MMHVCHSGESAVKKVVVWPVWSDSDIEKQEQAASGKGRDKAKASHIPSVSQLIKSAEFSARYHELCECSTLFSL